MPNCLSNNNLNMTSEYSEYYFIIFMFYINITGMNCHGIFSDIRQSTDLGVEFSSHLPELLPPF